MVRKGRVADIRAAQGRVQRIVNRRLRDEIQGADEATLARDAEESLRAARLFRLGPLKKGNRTDDE